MTIETLIPFVAAVGLAALGAEALVRQHRHGALPRTAAILPGEATVVAALFSAIAWLLGSAPWGVLYAVLAAVLALSTYVVTFGLPRRLRVVRPRGAESGAPTTTATAEAASTP